MLGNEIVSDKRMGKILINCDQCHGIQLEGDIFSLEFNDIVIF